MGSPLGVWVDTERLIAGVRVVGELDAGSSACLRRALADLFDHGYVDVSIGLGEVTFIDASGINVLAGANRRARQFGGAITVSCVSTAVRRVLEITGIVGDFGLKQSPPSQQRFE